MIILILFVAVLVALGLASMRWGFDSRDSVDSPEWQRRATLTIPAHRA